MTVQQSAILVRWFLLLGLLAATVTSSVDLISHPLVVTTAGAEGVVYLALFILVLLLYGGVALFRTRAAIPNEPFALQQGIRWGLVCGGVWIFEVLVANVIGPQLGPLYLACYFGSIWIAMLLPGLAALLAARQTGEIKTGLRAGLMTGMCGGLILFLVVSLPLFPLLIGTNHPDAQTMNEFHQSGLPDLQTFLIGDWLAALIAHLWIGVITGCILGIVGGVVGKALPIDAAAGDPARKRSVSAPYKEERFV